jgi:hypothetical protein
MGSVIDLFPHLMKKRGYCIINDGDQERYLGKPFFESEIISGLTIVRPPVIETGRKYKKVKLENKTVVNDVEFVAEELNFPFEGYMRVLTHKGDHRILKMTDPNIFPLNAVVNAGQY